MTCRHSPPGMNSLQQQARFDDFLHEFNAERPHQALAMNVPAEVYVGFNTALMTGAETPLPVSRPRHPRHRLRPDLSAPQEDQFKYLLAGQALGIKEVDDGIWLVSFMHYDLGYIDLEEKTLQPLNNPFGPRVVTYVLGTFCYLCLRARHFVEWRARRDTKERTRKARQI